MVRAGLLEETAQLLAEGVLVPGSPPGRAIGYRQTIDYLLGHQEGGHEDVVKSFKVGDGPTCTRDG
jgi:tRNA A37 N6-isopentenylltransferase MiaA